MPKTKRTRAKREQSDKRCVPAAAYALLARQPHSRAQLRIKLERKGYAAGEIDGCLHRLDELGYLDDEQVARRWAQTMLRERCWGALKAEQHLLQRGIEREQARRILAEVQREIPQIDSARQALAGRFGRQATDVPLKKIVNFLRSRGFCAEVVYEAAQEWEKRKPGSECDCP